MTDALSDGSYCMSEESRSGRMFVAFVGEDVGRGVVEVDLANARE